METWPGKDGWMKKKPRGLKISTSERAYSKERLDKMINDNLSPNNEVSLAKGLPIDILHDFKIHFKGKYRIRYRGKSDITKRYFREPNHCLQEFAKSFAIYPVDYTEKTFSQSDVADMFEQQNDQLANLMKTWRNEYA